jgi:hypothetical protein
MEMVSPDTTRGSYETYIPLKDAAPSSPVDQQRGSSLEQSSMNLTVYEELPTFVDPNDCTWAANDSLVEETKANRVRGLLLSLLASLYHSPSLSLSLWRVTHVTAAPQQAPARRSKRKKVQPLAYWKNERVVYGFEEGALPPPALSLSLWRREAMRVAHKWSSCACVLRTCAGEKMRSVKDIVRITSPEVSKKSSKKKRGAAAATTTKSTSKGKSKPSDTSHDEKKKKRR